MARPRRRTGKAQKTPEPTTGAADDDSQMLPEPEAVEGGKAQDERCPACRDEAGQPPLDAADKEKWVRCDACKIWFHWRCAGDGDLDAVDKWWVSSSLCNPLCAEATTLLTCGGGGGQRRFCRPCLDADPARVITMKPPTRKSTRKKTQRDYAGLNVGQEMDPNRWLRMMEGKEIKKDPFKRMKGADVGIEWLESDELAMTEPVLIETEEGLGMKMPPTGFSVNDVAEALGEEFPVEVIGTCFPPVRGHVVSFIWCRNTCALGARVVHRCRNTVKCTLDSGQMGRVLEHRVREARQDS